MRVLIVEGNPEGHHLYYVRIAADAALAQGDEVALLTTETAVRSPEYARVLGGRPVRVLVEESPSDIRVVAHASRRIGADVTLVLAGELVLRRLALAGRWRGSGLLRVLMIRSRMPRHGADALHRLRVAVKRIAIRLVSTYRGVEVLHLVPPLTGDAPGRFAVSDPVELTDAHDAVERWRRVLDPDVAWFGVLGVVSARKNVPMVLDALQRIDGAARRTGLLVAGRIDPEVRKAIDAHAARHGRPVPVVVVDRLLEEEELDAAVRAVHCVVLAHSNEGSSGILGKALGSGTRVLAAGAESLRDACEAAPLGTAWTLLTAADLAAGAARVLEMPAPEARPVHSNFATRLLEPA